MIMTIVLIIITIAIQKTEIEKNRIKIISKMEKLTNRMILKIFLLRKQKEKIYIMKMKKN
jgi:hypothetical protein